MSMQQSNLESRKGVLFTALSVVIMSFAPILNKISMSKTDPITASCLSTIAATLFSAFYCKWKVGTVSLPRHGTLVVAGLFNGLGLSLLFKSLDILNPALVAFLSRTHIVFALIFSAVALKESLTTKQWILSGLTALSALVFSFKGNLDSSHLYGVVCILASAFSFASANVLAKINTAKLHPSVAVFGSNFYSLPIVVGAALIFKGSLNAVDLQSSVMVFTAAFLNGFLGLLLYFEGLKHTSFAKANAIRACSPLIVVFFSLPLFPLQLSALNIVGGVLLILFTIALVFSKTTKEHKVGNISVCWCSIPEKFDSVLVVPREGDRFLYVQNKNRGWEFPGGHREADESIFDVAHREAFEEAGVKLKDLLIEGHYKLGNGHVTAVVSARVQELLPIPAGFETVARRFFESIPQNLSFQDGLYPVLVHRLQGSRL